MCPAVVVLTIFIFIAYSIGWFAVGITFNLHTRDHLEELERRQRSHVHRIPPHLHSLDDLLGGAVKEIDQARREWRG